MDATKLAGGSSLLTCPVCSSNELAFANASGDTSELHDHSTVFNQSSERFSGKRWFSLTYFTVRPPSFFLYSWHTGLVKSNNRLKSTARSAQVDCLATKTKHGQGVGTSPTRFHSPCSTRKFVVNFSQSQASIFPAFMASLASSNDPVTCMGTSSMDHPCCSAMTQAIRCEPLPIRDTPNILPRKSLMLPIPDPALTWTPQVSGLATYVPKIRSGAPLVIAATAPSSRTHATSTSSLSKAAIISPVPFGYMCHATDNGGWTVV
mmetsp:Transcript_57582/g.134865  ORF Transcript_57582/g.134865 Transcript_57582/m.134865 type:complete len:263 (+) Transcript_57582:23-811(+)